MRLRVPGSCASRAHLPPARPARVFAGGRVCPACVQRPVGRKVCASEERRVRRPRRPQGRPCLRGRTQSPLPCRSAGARARCCTSWTPPTRGTPTGCASSTRPRRRSRRTWLPSRWVPRSGGRRACWSGPTAKHTRCVDSGSPVACCGRSGRPVQAGKANLDGARRAGRAWR